MDLNFNGYGIFVERELCPFFVFVACDVQDPFNHIRLPGSKAILSV